MLVVTFAIDGVGNCVEVAGEPYVYARTKLGEFVLGAKCPHRGGPLHLAQVDGGRARLVCPWHEKGTSITKWLRSGIPAVRKGNSVTAVFPLPADTEHVIAHRPLSPGLRACATTAGKETA